MKAMRVSLLIVVTVTLLLPALAAVAQGERRINQDFNAPLKDILQVLKRVGNLGEFTIPEGYGDKAVSVSIVDKTASEAFTQVLDAVDLVAINDAGTLVIKPKPGEKGPRQAEPVHTPAGSIVGREPPRPVRTDAGGGDVSKPAAGTPGATDAAGAAQKKDKIYRLIVPNYMNLMMLSDIFGGSSIDENNYLGGSSSSGGNGNSGNSGNNGNNGNNGNSGNRGNSGGNRGNSGGNNGGSRW